MKTVQKILVIDDEADLLRLLQVRLESQDYSVELAASGLEGLKKAKENLPSVILLDLMMPGMDGFEVCRQLKLDLKTQRIPIVALTALGEEEATKRAMRMGFASYIVKPFNAEALLATLDQVVKDSKLVK